MTQHAVVSNHRMRSPIESGLHVKYSNRIPNPAADLHLKGSTEVAVIGVQSKRLPYPNSTCDQSPDLLIARASAASRLFVFQSAIIIW